MKVVKGHPPALRSRAASNHSKWVAPIRHQEDGFKPGHEFRNELSQKPPSLAPERKQTNWSRVATGGALALTALGVVGGLLGAAGPAQAQTVISTQDRAEEFRSGAVVRVGSAQEVVDRFRVEDQIYVVGSDPLDGNQMRRLAEALKEHPHFYLVMTPNAGQIESFHGTVNHGIGGSYAFNSLVNAETGEKDGAVMFLYMDSSQGRQALLRSESLVDEAGVGEDHFEPGRFLFEKFKGPASRGDVVGGIEAVAETINSRVKAHVGALVEGATSEVTGAEARYPGARERAERFLQENGGDLGVSPQSWGQRLSEARRLLNSGDFQGARSLAQQLNQEFQTGDQRIAEYEHLKSEVATTLTQAQEALDRFRGQVLPDYQQRYGAEGLFNPDLAGWQARLDQSGTFHGQGKYVEAREQSRGVSRELAQYEQLLGGFGEAVSRDARLAARLEQLDARARQVLGEDAPLAEINAARAASRRLSGAIEARDANYTELEKTAETSVHDLEIKISRMESAQANARRMKLLIGGAVALGAVALVVLKHQRSSGARREAESALAQRERDIEDQTQALIKMMGQVPAGADQYQGQMKVMADRLIATIAESMARVGGAQKSLEKARELAATDTFASRFTSRPFDQALNILNDPDQRVAFSVQDTQDQSYTEIRSWKADMLRRGAAPSYNESLVDILEAMSTGRESAKPLIEKLAFYHQPYQRALQAGQEVRFDETFKGLEQAEAVVQKADAVAQEAQGKTLTESGLHEKVQNSWGQLLATAQGALLKARDQLSQNDYVKADIELATARKFADRAESAVATEIANAQSRLKNQIKRREDRQAREAARRAYERSRSYDYGSSYSGGYSSGSSSSGRRSSSSSSSSRRSSSSSSNSSGSGSSGFSWGSSSSSGSSRKSSSSSSSSGSSGSSRKSSWSSGSSGGSSRDSWKSGSSGGSNKDSWKSGSKGGGW